MKKRELFFGTATALVTPFSNGEVDAEAFCRLIDHQIESGVQALVIGGTTGEAATLSDKERYLVFSLAKERCEGRAKLVLGTGTNDTRLAVSHTVMAKKTGCDGVLVVTPYYNRGTAQGVVKHYQTIANSTDLPIILYNVPGRTGVDLSFSTLETLSREENIVGIKEASDSVDRLVRLAAFGEELRLYAGNDSAAYTVLSLGGSGVISVASNLFPKEMVRLCRLYKEGAYEECLRLQLSLLPVIRALFTETNPSPIKYAMWRYGERAHIPAISGELRLPLSEVSEVSKTEIDFAVESFLAKNGC